MNQVIDIKELNEKIEKKSIFVQTLINGMESNIL